MPKPIIYTSRKIFYRTILLHIFCWTVLIGCELSYVYYLQNIPKSNAAPHVFGMESPYLYICYYALNISLFYAQYYILNNVLHKASPHYWKILPFSIALFLVYLLLKVLLDYYWAPSQHWALGRRAYIVKSLPGNIYRGIYFVILSLFFGISSYISFFRRKAAESERNELLIRGDKAELEARLAEARNAYLEQQINPHLLFNSLNFIYGSVYPHSQEASRSVWLLAEIMRFSLDGTGPDGKVELNKEMEQLEHLVEINRYRYHEHLYLSVNRSGNFSHKRIIPLILMTLTENVFKHGQLRDPTLPAELSLSLDDHDTLSYYSRNQKKAKGKYQQNKSIGLSNMIVRLNYSYPEKYQLHIQEDETSFELSLTIEL